MHEIKQTDYRKGWLIPYLLALDYNFYQRWDYWTRAVLQDKIPDESIPYISFKPSLVYQQRQVIKNITRCLSYADHRCSNSLEKFIDWILWGFNRIESFPAINETIDDYWYRTFNLGLFYEEPGDHFAEIAAESNVGRGSGYFPTPGHVVELMVRMNFGDEPQHEHKHLSVMDPCCGTGVMLLYASNYSLNLYGVDIHPLIHKIALVNSFIYVPWLAFRPKHLTMFDSIIEIERPTGIRIPQCTICNNKTNFLLDIQTDHEIEFSPLGFFNIHQPKINSDVIGKGLKPDNITCAKCFQEEDTT